MPGTLGTEPVVADDGGNGENVGEGTGVTTLPVVSLLCHVVDAAGARTSRASLLGLLQNICSVLSA